jgi:predicted 3-demethylubiquinone-9 3-methyltransferase (glyoxalase superfamily)
MDGNALTTCLWFDTEAEAAANFYISIFKDSRLGGVSHYGDTGPGTAGTVMTVEFELNGQRFVALNGGPEYTFSAAVSFQIPCADQDEVDYYWSRLSAGGREVACGWVTDKFGLSWQVIPSVFFEMMTDPDPDKASRVMSTMLTMTKFDVAALQKAYAG